MLGLWWPSQVITVIMRRRKYKVLRLETGDHEIFLKCLRLIEKVRNVRVSSAQCPVSATVQSRGGPQLSSWDRGGPALPSNSGHRTVTFLVYYLSFPTSMIVLNLPCSPPKHVWGVADVAEAGLVTVLLRRSSGSRHNVNSHGTVSTQLPVSASFRVFSMNKILPGIPAPGTLARDGGAEHKLLIASDISLLIFSFFIVSLVSYTKCLFLIDLINVR